MLPLALSAGLLALAVTVKPARLEMRAEAPAARVIVSGLSPKSRAVHVWASVGTVGAAHLLPDGTVEATYHPPKSGAPTFAVVAAWDEGSGEAAAASIELYGRVEIPVETDPGAEVTVQVGGRRASAHASAKGAARVSAWVPPGVLRARVTAADAAGNATVTEVALDVPPPTRVWLLAPSPPGPDGRVRLYAFALAPAVPRLTARGAPIETSEHPGVSTGVVPVQGEVTVDATVEGGRAERVLRPDAAPVTSQLVVDLGGAGPSDELGASIGPRFSGALIGVALTGEWRHRLGRSRFFLGLDLAALYASGDAYGLKVALGAGLARAVFEARFPFGDRVVLVPSATVGAALAGEQRTPPNGKPRSAFDGGPSLGLFGSLLVRVGPGDFTVTVGYAWTPLLGLGISAVLDGGIVSVGYRFAIGAKR